MKSLESKLNSLPSDLPDCPPTDSPFSLISSYPPEPDRQPFSGLLAFTQAVLTAWMHSSLCFTDSNCTCDICGGQGRGCPSVWNARPGETLAKEVAIKLDTSHPPTWTMATAYRPPDLAFNHMSAVLHCYLNVVPF